MDNEAYECPECLKKIPGADQIIKRREAEKKEKRSKLLKIIGGSVLAVALITGLTILVATLARKDSTAYMKPVNHYINGCVKNDYGEYISAFPEYYRMMFSQQFAYIVIGDIPSDAEKMYTADLLYHDEYYKSLVSRFGSDFDITYKINSEKKLTPEELGSFRDEYLSFSGSTESLTEFEDGYEISVSFNVKGNLGTTTITDKAFRLIKMDGEWYMMNYIDFLMEKEDTTLANKK